ncbi:MULTISPECIES: PTS sugar transporter subunit IIA [Lactobacillaceae]|uniref:PTS sugar transporter subunit IIA n=1 Tax=Lactobacillaceae TaxID=33958 RepID=UPI0005800A88|nr:MULTISPECIES: PTS fructose transporter subunit IIA [Lactobacillaceae]KAF1280908.1 PTS fructose transporter subunit IIA [Lactiplantibacillus plantarum]MCP9334311.1 PTS fructose transporter subunit IIA [Lentilactobacillus hilgardii]MCP9350879.1 PTS fructose transporter subunit IIA [Lentilactobacillus hilgardii]MCP9353777.1 PTS fructose transporter subunit IIA [Lentilactobacillus hilgardii]RAH93784.1 PTS fructose transporter subunit IIA [Lactiplantibacillus plantarum]
MTKELILISHGDFCIELKKSIEMIMGPQENIHAIGLVPGEGPEEFKHKFNSLTESFNDFVVFADLMGGTPCNTVAGLLMEGDKKFDLYAGMNMPMIISYINSEIVNEKPNIVEDAKNGVIHINEVI